LTEIANKKSTDEIINKFDYVYNQQDLRSSETITNGDPVSLLQDDLVTYDYNIVNQLLSSTSPEKTFEFDNDGNMTNGYTPEGFVFTAGYDAENRLKSIEYTDGAEVLHKTDYLYAGDNFLARQVEYENGVLNNDVRFIRDGYLTVQERDPINTVSREYLWGVNAGGGIGGLLNLREGTQDYSYLYDGKGNVAALNDGSQSVAAAYTYDPFGNLMAKTGSLNQSILFSTKPYDEKIGISYYGYRFYSPVLGKWINRDILGETGGINLYGFVRNSPITLIDSLGLFGFGVIGSSSVESGVVAAGGGISGSLSEGAFIGGPNGIQTGSFMSRGGYIGGPAYGPSLGHDNSSNVTGGAFAGAGGGVFLTNARCSAQLEGNSNVFSLNGGLLLGGSVQFGISKDGTWNISLTVGPGIGASGSQYTNETLTIY
jgi:RHS repeat-associated protein